MRLTKLTALFLGPLLAVAAMAQPQPGYIAGDFHQHSFHTDGSYHMPTVFMNANAFGLNWWANSEHGAFTATIDGQTSYRWQDFYGDTNRPGGVYVPQTIVKGGVSYPSTFQEVLNGRAAYPNRTILQGLELNAPGHEHASTAIVANQFGANPNCDPIAQFEFQFDRYESAPDTAFTQSQGWIADRTSGHQSSLRAAQWLQANYPTQSWFIPAHPERRTASDSGSGNGWTLKSLRELNDVAPTVFFGFESMPGHQKASNRGEYGTSSMGGGTYGGCGIYAARVGGVWDNMLAEGRRFWLFASSDFHNTGADFWPGEYQKTYSAVPDVQNVTGQDIVDSLRSGNSYIVNGDLINELRFSVTNNNTGQTAQMGQFLPMNPGDSITIDIRFKSPATNNHGDEVLVNLVQLIQGDVVGPVNPSDYVNYLARQSDGMIVDGANNPADISNAQVIKLFNRAANEPGQFYVDANGYTVLTFTTIVDGQKYFRIRGTNNLLGNGEVDAWGNPVLDVPGTNTAAAAWADLWFYSNPIGVPEPASALLCVLAALTLRRR
jgi:hypothetical protein